MEHNGGAVKILKTVELHEGIVVDLAEGPRGFYLIHRDTDAGETVGTTIYDTRAQADDAVAYLEADAAFQKAWNRLEGEKATLEASEDTYGADDAENRLDQIELWLDDAGNRMVHEPATFTKLDLLRVRSYAAGGRL